MKRTAPLIVKALLIGGLFANTQPMQAGWFSSLSNNFSVGKMSTAVMNKACACWQSFKKSDTAQAGFAVVAAAGCYIAWKAYRVYTQRNAERERVVQQTRVAAAEHALVRQHEQRRLEQVILERIRLERATRERGRQSALNQPIAGPGLIFQERYRQRIKEVVELMGVADRLLQEFKVFRFPDFPTANFKVVLMRELDHVLTDLRKAFTDMSVLTRRTDRNFAADVHNSYIANMIDVGAHPRDAYQLLGLSPRTHAHVPWTDIKQRIQGEIEELNDLEELKNESHEERKRLLRQLMFFFSNFYSFEEYRAYLDGEPGLNKLRITDRGTINELRYIVRDLPHLIFDLDSTQCTLVGGL